MRSSYILGFYRDLFSLQGMQIWSQWICEEESLQHDYIYTSSPLFYILSSYLLGKNILNKLRSVLMFKSESESDTVFYYKNQTNRPRVKAACN